MWVCGILLLLSAAAFLVRRLPRVSLATVAVVFAFLGAFTGQSRDAAIEPQAGIMRFTSGQEVVLTGHVVRDGIVRQGSFGGQQQSIDLAVEQAETEDYIRDADQRHGSTDTLQHCSTHGAHTPRTKKNRWRMRMATRSTPLLYGQQVRLTAKLRPAMNYKNPGAWDYRGYLASIGISALGSAKAEGVELLPGRGGSRLSAVALGGAAQRAWHDSSRVGRACSRPLRRCADRRPAIHQP